MASTPLFECGIRLNEIGKEMLETVEQLIQIGLLEIKEGEAKGIDVAPWHSRDV